MEKNLRSVFIGLLFGMIPLSAQCTIYVNQCGYLPQMEKIAYTDEGADSFFVSEATSGRLYFAGKWQWRKSDDPSTGLTLYEADFSTLQIPGRYYIRNKSGSHSVNFTIADSVFHPLVRKSLKGLYFQRCGLELDKLYAAPWNHGSCHTADAIFHSSCDRSGYMETGGGWHDAGDYGKYIVPANIAVGTLLLFSEKFPDYLSSDNMNIPESNNGIPDLLDETRYELNWMLRMQDSLDGGVYFKVTTKDFVGWVMPDKSFDPRYIYEKSSTATAGFAAVTARAARVYEAYDPNFAQKCRSAAQKAWDFLEQHPSIVPPGGFHNPDDTETGEYGDEDDSDERLWAAAELFETSGEKVYDRYFQDHYQDGPLFEEQMSWGYVKPLAQITYLTGEQSAANPSVKSTIRSALYDYGQEQTNLMQKDGFRVAMEGWEYYWGSNSVVLNKAILLLFAYEESGDAVYRKTALHQLDYILGVNGHNMTFVTSVGSNSPHHIHHAPSASDGVDEPVPGLMAGGPDKYLDDPELQAAFNSQTPPAMCYLDVLGSYASNEITVYWNASLIFVSAYFNKGNGSTSIIGKTGFIVNNIRLYQNYPNPFGEGNSAANHSVSANPSTVIRYEVGISRKPTVHVRLTIYNVLGQKVKELVNGYQSAGMYRVRFNGNNLASGVYFYRLVTDDLFLTRKMLLMR